MLNVRSKVASKISKIKEADDFNFSNWLKKPLHHDHPVEQLASYLADVEDLVIEFVPPEFSEFTFDMPEPEVTDELKNCEFKKIKSNAIFFMIALPLEKGTVVSDVELKHESFSSKSFEFLPAHPSIKELKVKFAYDPPKEFDFKIQTPASKNYLENLVPEVFKIDLLDFEDLVSSAKKVKVKNIGLDKFKKTKFAKVNLPVIPKTKKIYKIKVPSIGNYKFSETSIALPSFTESKVSESTHSPLLPVKTWYANFKIPQVEYSLMFNSPSAKSKHGIKPAVPNVTPYLKEQLSLILSNIRKVDWEKSGKKLTKLEPYEEDSVKFLIENDYALLQDEFGINIQKETIAALKLLFRNRIVKSALIITDGTILGNPKFAKYFSVEIGWSDKIIKYCPELSIQIIEGNNDEREKLWSKSKHIVLADIDTALSDYDLKIFDQKSLSKFDCVILDSVEQILSNDGVREGFLSAIHPKILWATSSVLDNSIHNELNNLLDSSLKVEKTQLRSKQSLADTLPKFMLNEFWCDADEKQLGEFKTALTECKKDLRRVLESGNPLRFYANIFTLYHKLNQIGNFASAKSGSPKADLLLRHLSMIKKNGKKVLILSQYEKLGIKKIAELLNNHEIKNVLAPNALSAEDMETAISTFQSQDDIVAFISDAKIGRLKFPNFNIPYVIKFDQWWNPISNWELEDIFLKDGDQSLTETVNLCNYYSSGTLDQRLRELLLKSDLLNRNIFELMQPKLYEELILVDEWLHVFEMPVSGDEKKEQVPENVQVILQKTPLDSFRKLLSRLFTILGFSNVDILELPNSNSFNIIGKAQRNGREFFLNAHVFIERKIDKKTVENIISEAPESNQDKIFIISREELPEVSAEKMKPNVTLMDGLRLAKLIIRSGMVPTAPESVSS